MEPGTSESEDGMGEGALPGVPVLPAGGRPRAQRTLRWCASGAALAALAALLGLGSAAGRSARGPAAAAPSRLSRKVAVDCTAFSEDECLQRQGCRWFSYSGGCPNCEAWLGTDQGLLTGCRDWDPLDYCQKAIFQTAQKKSGKAPTDLEFKDVIRHYEISVGPHEKGAPQHKRLACDVWCDVMPPSPCFGQPRAKDGLRGVNYGGRFVPEKFLGLPGTDEYLFKGARAPVDARAASFCDIRAGDLGYRMSRFLDENIKEEHFVRMAELGFNLVRLPLGYWNLIDLPGGEVPDGPHKAQARWANLQRAMRASDYRKWIDQVFRLAEKVGMRVLLDLHGAPGGQSGNECTGCDLGGSDAVMYFVSVRDTGRNMKLAVSAIEEMARICAEKGDTCYGIELLNEPYGAHTDSKHSRDLEEDLAVCAKKALDNEACSGLELLYDLSDDTQGMKKSLVERRLRDALLRQGAEESYAFFHISNTSRKILSRFYEHAIKAARAHLRRDKPIVIMDWPSWLGYWLEQSPFTYAQHGHIQFSTHVYKFPEPPTIAQQAARDAFNRDMTRIWDFTLNSRFALIVSEYAVNSHGTGTEDDSFNYNALTDWFVHQFNQKAIGSVVYNFDAYWLAWGPVSKRRVGRLAMNWKSINA